MISLLFSVSIADADVESVAFTYNTKLSDNLKLAYAIGHEVGYPETLQAILMQETGGGVSERVGNKNLPVGKRCYGLMQVQVIAARSVFVRYPDVFNRYFPSRNYNNVMDEEIIALLLTNDEANVRIAAYHFKIYITMTKGDWSRAVAGYNQGIGNALKLPNPSQVGYVQGVKHYLVAIVRPFNKAEQQ